MDGWSAGQQGRRHQRRQYPGKVATHKYEMSLSFFKTYLPYQINAKPEAIPSPPHNKSSHCRRSAKLTNAQVAKPKATKTETATKKIWNAFNDITNESQAVEGSDSDRRCKWCRVAFLPATTP